MLAACFLSALVHKVTTFGSPLKADIGAKASTAQKFKFLFLLVQRLFLAKGVQIIRLQTGGHHVHLTQAEDVISAARPWLQQTNEASPSV